MKIEALPIPGSALIRLVPHLDERGFFSRIFCVEEFAAAGLPTQMVQSSISFNARRGTVRGMHFQWPPSREGKLVRCLKGSVIDVLLDLRPHSATYLQHVSLALNETNRDAAFIPHGVAHGFQTLADESEVMYQMTDFYAAQLGAGVRWDDPRFGIAWPIGENIIISARDARYPDFERNAFEAELLSRSGAMQ
jgi:dTDP-4-dehydrorhamnose 3,5-epimerase